MILHAGLIALRRGGAWRGVLILGPAGVGKSDLALRALDEGFALVADDRTRLFLSRGALFGCAPAPLRDLLEVRGLGVVQHAARRAARVELCVQCKTNPAAVERLPEPRTEMFLGIQAPVMDLWPLEISATAKIRRAIEALGARR